MRERKRIWTTGATVNEWRELCSIGSNEFGDVLLTLDGGEVWQFTPHKPLENTPRIDEVTHAGIMRDSKTNIPTSLAYMILQEPRRELHGNIRVLPIELQAEPEKPKRVKRIRRGKVHQYEGHEKWTVQTLIKGIIGGKQPKGTPRLKDKQVVTALRKQAAEHTFLKGLAMPAQRTLEGWVAMVRKGMDIPGATSGKHL